MPRLKSTCLQCGKDFEYYTSEKDGKYCSNKCFHEGQKGKTTKKALPTIEIICKHCGKTFFIKPYENKRFCSKSCSSLNANGFKGKTHSEKTKRTIGTQRKNWWSSLSEEERKQEIEKRIRRGHTIHPNTLAAIKRHMNENNPMTNEESRLKASKTRKEKIIKGEIKTPIYGYHGGFIEDLGHYVRSSWEENYCRILQYLKIEYLYEPKAFDLGEGLIYIPDIYIPAKDIWIEIKGFYRGRDEDKIFKFKTLGYNLIEIKHQDYKRLKKYWGDKIKWHLTL